ncbi:prepilin peptidase [Actinosynnema sp. ALI-1.44]|uniref:prepilin peptidase n=1 Tax=Actinosynnema sp. ALI-1.44 TaxID=1933779 RepID=UPI0011773EAB|nr:prepilin peptidase [Actinosynnema sp. ALI-1.44]
MWTGIGLLVGAAMALIWPRLLVTASSGSLTARLAALPLTAVAFGGMAWRFGPQFDLLPCSVLAAVGVGLSLIDLLERRLPSALVYTGLVLIGGLLVTSAVLHSKGSDLLRAWVGMAIISGFYLVLALLSEGGLGAGDVKLGGLLGLALGWLSWSTLITATFLGWLTAALVWLLLKATRRRQDSVPMGPFLLFGALFTIAVVPM